MKDKIRKLQRKDVSPVEIYDTMAEISAIPIVKVADGVYVGDIDGFVKEFCNVTQYYERPQK